MIKRVNFSNLVPEDKAAKTKSAETGNDAKTGPEEGKTGDDPEEGIPGNGDGSNESNKRRKREAEESSNSPDKESYLKKVVICFKLTKKHIKNYLNCLTVLGNKCQLTYNK